MAFSLAYLLALSVGVYTAILLVVRAFQSSVAWGLVALLVPLGYPVFAFTHWAAARKVFIAHAVSLAALAALILFHPHRGNGRGSLDAEIAHLQDKTAQLQQQVDSGRASLVPVYNGLAQRRPQLKAGDQQAVAQFNLDAAAYAARKTQLDALQNQLDDQEDRLSELLATRDDIEENDAHGVTIYGTDWCPACKAARDYMQSKGIAYRDVDIEHSHEGAEEFQQRGGGPIPMIVINGAQTTGFNSAWVDAHLQ